MSRFACPHCGREVANDQATTVLAPPGADLPTIPPPAVAAARQDAPRQEFAPPGYEVLGELGRGGMGVVYRARHLALNREVALKMILSGGHAADEERRRFLAEAEAIAAIQHAGIVQVFDFGTHGDLPYFALELCSGGSLADRLAGTPLPSKDAARVVEQVARAVQAAHDRGIVHRDLKPANVLLSRRASCQLAPAHEQAGSLLYDPKVTDFGLAKRVEGGSGLTRTGAVMGTPSYMAPEQAEGRKDVGPLADVYALGAILYECLTGRPPFRAETPLDTLLQVVESDPAPPSVLNPAVPRDLETVCLKCLQKHPDRRYRSAGELADELGRYLSGESIRARSYNLLDWVAGALERSHFDVQFHAWGTMLLWFAAMVFVCYAGTTAVLWTQAPWRELASIGLHALMFAGMAIVFWRTRTQTLLPTTTAERQMYSVLVGFVVGCVLLGVLNRLVSPAEYTHVEESMYPRFAVVSGITFLVLGSSYWGGCYVFAGLFWLFALLSPFCLPLAPLGFGVLWSAALIVIGRRLRRLAPPADAQRNVTQR